MIAMLIVELAHWSGFDLVFFNWAKLSNQLPFIEHRNFKSCSDENN